MATTLTTINDHELNAAAFSAAAAIREYWDGYEDIDAAVETARQRGIDQLEYSTPGMPTGDWYRVDHWELADEDVDRFRALVAEHLATAERRGY